MKREITPVLEAPCPWCGHNVHSWEPKVIYQQVYWHLKCLEEEELDAFLDDDIGD